MTERGTGSSGLPVVSTLSQSRSYQRALRFLFPCSMCQCLKSLCQLIWWTFMCLFLCQCFWIHLSPLSVCYIGGCSHLERSHKVAKCCFNELIYFYTLLLGWSTSIQNGMLVIVEVSCLEKSPGPILLKTIKVNSDFTWTVTYWGHLVSNKCEVLQRFPSLINTGKFVA